MDPRLEAERFWPRLRDALDRVPPGASTPPQDARVGAVLVLIEEGADGPGVVLTRRRLDMRSHPGQVSFPGGRLDPGETIEQAAVREADEEIGLRADTVEVVGVGTMFYIPPSRFWVVPVLGRWRRPHELKENPWEVDEVLRVPLAQLLDRDRWRHAPLSLEGSTWAWQLDNDLLWGATAMVMGQLLDAAVVDWNEGLAPQDLGEDLAVRPWETAPSWERRTRLVGDLPAIAQDDVPHVDAATVRAVRSWLAERGVDPLRSAEQAARALAQAVLRLRGGSLDGLTVTVLAGPSSNGAGGLAAARLLASAGAEVDVVAVGPARHPQQAQLLREVGVAVWTVEGTGIPTAHAPGEVVIDAMLGIGSDPPLRASPGTAATWLRRHDVAVVALDLPSGLSADHGLRGPCVSADVTVALGLPTVGLRSPIVHPYLGDLYLADLGVPAPAWRAVGVEVFGPSPFAAGPLVRLTAVDRATDAGTPDQAEVDRTGVGP